MKAHEFADRLAESYGDAPAEVLPLLTRLPFGLLGVEFNSDFAESS